VTCGDQTTFHTKLSVLGLLLLSKSCKAARPSRGSAQTNLAYLLEEMRHQDTHEGHGRIGKKQKHKNKNKKEHFEFEASINKESSTEEADNAPYREE